METATKTRYKGLCKVCKLTPGCTFPRDQGRGVIDCLEFEGLEAKNGKTHRAHVALDMRASPQDHELLGLCHTCERLSVCSFSKPASGVWFCEEYT